MNKHDIFFSKSSVLDLICFDLSRTEMITFCVHTMVIVGFFRGIWKLHPFRRNEIQAKLEFWYRWSRNTISIFLPVCSCSTISFTNQNRFRPPADFPLTSHFSSIVHHVYKAPVYQFLFSLITIFVFESMTFCDHQWCWSFSHPRT